MGNQNDEVGKISEEICQEDIIIGRDTEKEIREWSLDNIKLRCVIWCRNMAF